MPFTSLYSSSLNIFTLALFISSTAFTILSSFTFDFLTFSRRSIPFTIISTTSVLFISSYSDFTNVSFSLSFSTPISQSSLLLRLSAFSILLPRTCFKVKLKQDRYRVYLACLLFNFCTFIKYSRFLWSVQISNFSIVPSRKCLHASKYLTTTNISLSYIL